ncbi:MAG: hypothetical protein GEV11_13280 [Streptosporangiales bacterium]|nr:hypothetical protein [Streptosporangiales bacterium]
MFAAIIGGARLYSQIIDGFTNQIFSVESSPAWARALVIVLWVLGVVRLLRPDLLFRALPALGSARRGRRRRQ